MCGKTPNLFLVNPIDTCDRLALFWNNDINLVVWFSRVFFIEFEVSIGSYVCILVQMILFIENSGRSWKIDFHYVNGPS